MICRTLGVSGAGPAPAARTERGHKARRGTAVAEVPSAAFSPEQAAGAPGLAQVSNVGGAQPGRSRGHGRGLLALVGLIVVGGLCLWAFTGIFSLAFHVGEFVAVALLAGWAGYRVGHFKGRRGR
jgi:hypothetical protein